MARLETGSPARQGPAGKVCYAIGDIHGRLDLLDDLLKAIKSDIDLAAEVEAHVVLLGDLVDRGPDSRGVLARVRKGLDFEAKLHAIRGNHEAMMLAAIREDPDRLTGWVHHGGHACLQSYGVEMGRLFSERAETFQRLVQDEVPRQDLELLDSLVDSVRFGDYFLTHAGVRPGVALDDQSPDDLAWIRKPFLESDRDHGAVIIHGHSIVMTVEERPNRIGIDTGAWKTGVLTALKLSGSTRTLLQVSGPPMPDRGWFD